MGNKKDLERDRQVRSAARLGSARLYQRADDRSQVAFADAKAYAESICMECLALIDCVGSLGLALVDRSGRVHGDIR